MSIRDIGATINIQPAFTLALTSAAAGLSTSSTGSMGVVLDRLSYGDYHSAKAVVNMFSRVASTSGSGYCTVTLNIEHGDSSNSTSMSALTTAASKTIGTTGAAAANTYEYISQDLDVNTLRSAKRFIRQIVTITKVATSSVDTLQGDGGFIFAGAMIEPTT